jgi:transcriptional regulator with XRE-family HTH domain
MKLGDVLKKERERKGLSSMEVASSLGLSLEDYMEMEAGLSPLEEWGPKLSRIAVRLKTPTSRLINEDGVYTEAEQARRQCGKLIKRNRERIGLTQEELARRLDLPLSELILIENGESLLETYAPILLHFAEIVNQPIFNLSFPCGLPLDKINDYP